MKFDIKKRCGNTVKKCKLSNFLVVNRVFILKKIIINLGSSHNENPLIYIFAWP